MGILKDPLAGSAWSEPATVAGFAASSPNPTLMEFAAVERARGARTLLDIGCGAGRNAIALAERGWQVTGVDLSWPMVARAAERARQEQLTALARFALASMEHQPICDRSMDFIVAHGIWNLAASSAQFRAAVREAARVARPGAALFVFTFSRTTLVPTAQPVAGESFIFTQFSGLPQCFLTHDQLLSELGDAGFTLADAVALRELNRPRAGTLTGRGAPVVYEAAFRLTG